MSSPRCADALQLKRTQPPGVSLAEEWTIHLPRVHAGFRQIYEPLWLQYGVDLLLSGHVHAYERSNPVANYSADPSGCAPVQLTVGDGGNHEGVRAHESEVDCESL